MPAPVRLEYQEGRPPLPSAPDSGNDIGTEQTSGDQGHTRQTRQSREKHSNSSTVMPAPVRLRNQEGRHSCLQPLTVALTKWISRVHRIKPERVISLPI